MEKTGKDFFLNIILISLCFSFVVWKLDQKYNVAMELLCSNMWMLFYARQHEIAGI